MIRLLLMSLVFDPLSRQGGPSQGGAPDLANLVSTVYAPVGQGAMAALNRLSLQVQPA
jgi:hypothetical protein